MTATDAVVRHLHAAASGARRVLMEDPHGLARLPAEIRTRDDLQPLQVIAAAGNLSFRARWEPLRHLDRRILVVRQRAEVYLPDFEAELVSGGLRVHLTPTVLLEWATGDRHWPRWVDGEAELVGGRLQAIAQAHRRFRHVSDTPLDDGDAERLLLSAALGLDIEDPIDLADAWQAFATAQPLLARLHERGSRLAARVRAWLHRQRAPVCWLNLTDPQAAIRLTWLVALLLPHVAELGLLLPRLYPGARLLEGEDPTAIARVAYRLERRAPELAAEQRRAAESVVAGPLRDGAVRFLNLHDAAAATDLLRREERSGLLVLMALRTLLEAVATDLPLVELGLEPALDALGSRLDRLTERDAVAVHLRLLRAVTRLEAVRQRLTRRSGHDLAAAAEAFVGSGADGIDADVETAREALCDNALAVTEYDPEPDAARHKAVMAALYHLVTMAEEAGAALESAALEAQCESPTACGLVPTDRALDERLAPLLAERGMPRSTLLLVGGLGWAGWRRLAAVVAGRYEVRVEPLCAPLPASSSLSLRRTVAGALWRPEMSDLPWLELLANTRPDLPLRGGPPPRALRGLAEAGLLVCCRTSRERLVVLVDLLAGSTGVLPPAEYDARVDQLAGAVRELAHSGRRDELAVLVSVSGAVRAQSDAGLALPGRGYGARAIVTSDAPPAAALVLNAREHGLAADPGESLVVAADRRRLVPCAAGATMADGGATLAERIVPLAVLTPMPAGGGAELCVGSLTVPAAPVAGEAFEVGLWVTLTGGALADIATLRVTEPDNGAVSATLDLGEPRWLGVALRLDEGAHPVEIELRVGRRVLRRRAVCIVSAAETGETHEH